MALPSSHTSLRKLRPKEKKYLQKRTYGFNGQADSPQQQLEAHKDAWILNVIPRCTLLKNGASPSPKNMENSTSH